MSTIKIDGREIPFENGDTIIRAAHRAGIDIPHYCWHPGLSVAANCRMCLVEVLPPPGRPAMQLDVLRWDAEKNDYVPARKPKLQPACQMTCAPGMEVLSEGSNHVSEARSSVQELLLLNHPVDCPICDQAGECRLQDYWLEHQRTGKRMKQEIIHKPKAVPFGPTIVYDAERCIVCTRCVRVTAELAKDPVLSVRERGNLGEIAVSPGRQLDNNYTLMTEHVCPVGALTSIDFRFKARVWFLRSARAICQGCATGCNAFLDYDPRTNTAHRYRPRENLAVNQYWMCDVGMMSYKRAHEGRLEDALVGGEEATLEEALVAAKEQLGNLEKAKDKLAVVLSAQHSNEDNFALLSFAKEFLGKTEFFLSGKRLGKGDGVLMSDDQNSNTRGAVLLAGTGAARPVADLAQLVTTGKVTHVLALGSEVEIEDAAAKAAFGKLKALVTIASHKGPLVRAAHVALPACAWTEADGTYVNKAGIAQKSERALRPLGRAKPAWDLVARLGRALGFAVPWKRLADLYALMPAGSFAVSSSAQSALPAGEKPAPAAPVPTAPAGEKPEARA